MVVVEVVMFGGFAAVEEKRLHIGSDSHEMPQGDDYKDFLKNNIIFKKIFSVLKHH